MCVSLCVVAFFFQGARQKLKIQCSLIFIDVFAVLSKYVFIICEVLTMFHLIMIFIIPAEYMDSSWNCVCLIDLSVSLTLRAAIWCLVSVHTLPYLPAEANTSTTMTRST